MIIDSHQRTINYLRISVTDRCNLRCGYCMPEEGISLLSHDDMLSYDEIIRLVKIMAGMGLSRVRLTGGEPLVRKDIDLLAREIKKINGIEYLGITTNGVLLKDMAEKLRSAGVDGLNISLDTVDAKRFEQITHRDAYAKVAEGIQTAHKLNFSKLKINCVLAPDSKPSDWLGVAEYAKKYSIDVRFIEWMPISKENEEPSFLREDLLDLFSSEFGKVEYLAPNSDGGPAQYWKIDGFKGRIGIIHAMSHNFCDSCNRIRLTSTGDLKLCLFYDVGIPLKDLLRGELRNESSDEKIAVAIQKAVLHKPKQHMNKKLNSESEDCEYMIRPNKGMYSIGG